MQVSAFAHFRDCDTQVPHGLGCAGMLHALTPVTRLLHIGLAFHFSCADAADHDVDMDISRMVMPIRVGADDGRMTGKVCFTEVQAESLCFFHGQAVVGCISGVKADDILVALNIIGVVVLVVLRFASRQAVANEKSPHSSVSRMYESRSMGLPC